MSNSNAFMLVSIAQRLAPPWRASECVGMDSTGRENPDGLAHSDPTVVWLRRGKLFLFSPIVEQGPFRHSERERPINSATLRNERLREFCPKSRPSEGSLPDPARNGWETEASTTWGRMSQTARNTGVNEKTPRGILSAFSVNFPVSDISLTLV